MELEKPGIWERIIQNNIQKQYCVGFILVLFVLFSFQSKAQTDTIQGLIIKTDSAATKARFDWKKRDPRRASLLSAILPGAGQLYNRKYWKLPIIAGGAYAFAYFINLNNEQYVLTRNAYLQRQANQPDVFNGFYSADQLVKLREYWRRNRDLLIILSAFTYLLNVADAAVDAHLSTFDVSDDLSFKIEPQLQLAGNQPVYGLGLLVTIR